MQSKRPTLLVTSNTTEGQMRYAFNRGWNLKIPTKVVTFNGRKVEIPIRQ